MHDAKARVGKIRRTLKKAYPKIKVADLHETALDLHDIEWAARDIAKQIRALYTKDPTKSEIQGMLCTINVQLFEHLIPNHAKPLKRFFAQREQE
ncbi:MAG: hypothetical protein LBW77_04435 [Verrucomicrobiota bacterium]|jgi:hypothetical protein|nr:hypothetical protein [Verrucomicrobiota bacterium]